MDKKERFKTAFLYLKEHGYIHTQKDLADKMGSTSPNVSSALKGIDSVLTDNFLKRFNAAFGSVFNEDWLIEGKGEMLQPIQHIGDINGDINGNNNFQVAANAYNDLLGVVAGFQKQSSRFQDEIERLLGIIEVMQKQ